ncbi:hypothetical protein J2X11_001242 [Aeromicrobium panaciterrae]|uniref:Thiamine pyrophosphate enzyme TPP-binding domain-containing protein n=1 Tax=Aeromicrobium panaciterrae TaxID=363861 RepID=A0ABU1UMJ3_9ACTN|nr:thiamine pyrophosphate-dependent enzyme [Aeromicrobium panaciterrae]MDR7086403.1 hypothetical protein [Aeromicrobium panaciterrae]
MTDRAQGLDALCSASLIATYPSIGVDQTLRELAHESDCPPVVVASSERAAGFVAEGFAASSGQHAMVLVDRYWARSIEPLLIPGTKIGVASAQDGRLEIRDAVEAVSGPAMENEGDSAERAALFAAVLPGQFHQARGEAEKWVRESGVGAVTTSGFDSFPRSDPDVWLGRVGFMASSAPNVRWALLPGAELSQSVPGERTVIASFHELEGFKASANGANSRPVAPTVEEFASPLPRLLVELARRVPTSIAVADAGTSHRAVAVALANRGHECLMTDVLTPMGWSLPAALGASYAHPGRPLLVVLGDGSALGAVADLALLASHRVPAIVVIATNGTLGSRQGNVRSQDNVGLELPQVNWERLCAAFNIPVTPHGSTDRHLLDDVVAHLETGSGPQVLLVDCPVELPDELAGPTGIPLVDAHFQSSSAAVGGI